MFRFLFLLFIIVPIIEIYLLIEVGGVIGAGWTIFAILLTAVIGVSLLRVQGATTLLRAQANMAKGQLPAMEMMEGMALAASGFLLLTPGFFTDTIGFLLLTPILRRALIKKIISNKQFTMHGQAGYSAYSRQAGSDIIEGEVVDETDDHRLR